MHPVEELTAEHRAVESSLRILAEIANRTEREKGIPQPGHLKELVEFFTVFVDKCHHGKEETFLFPALETKGVGREEGPIGVMLAEHVAGRAFVADIRRAVERFEDGRGEGSRELVAAARGYIDLLAKHIYKEDNVLFPMAREKLADEDVDRLTQGFARIEREEVGEGRHEAFHDLLERLSATYRT